MFPGSKPSLHSINSSQNMLSIYSIARYTGAALNPEMFSLIQFFPPGNTHIYILK